MASLYRLIGQSLGLWFRQIPSTFPPIDNNWLSRQTPRVAHEIHALHWRVLDRVLFPNNPEEQAVDGK